MNERKWKTRARVMAALGVLLALVATGCGVTPPVAGSDNVPAAYVAPASPLVTGVAYGPLAEQVLDVHLPTDRTGPFAVMIYVHGGGWIAGTRAVIPEFLLRQVSRAGIALVSIDYRLVTSAPDGSFVNSFPAADEDVDRAVRFVKANARTWNLDPERVLIAGASAGGHLAALAAAAPGAFVDPTLPAGLTTVSPRVDGVLDFVGISDFTTFGSAGGWAPGLMTAFLNCPVLQYELCDRTKIAAASVAPHLGADAPPAFLAYGAHDDLVAPATQGIPLADAWAKARGESGLTPLASRSVDFEQTDSGHNIDATSLDVAAMEAWIDAVVSTPASPRGSLRARR